MTSRPDLCDALRTTPQVLPSVTDLQEITLRPKVRGKFLFVGDKKLYIKGVTYGPFKCGLTGDEYHSPEVVRADFSHIAASGLNSIRTYTVPPRWLLDEAQRCGLRVMVGIPWEQHVTFLDDKTLSRKITRVLREAVRQCAGQPAVLAYAVGNEIPAPIVRWHGRRRIERFIERLYATAKEEDPDALVTYVNYPTTEYLQLPFLDFQCFNVYLESEEPLASYQARLQNIAGERPLVMAEIGLDSLRNGEAEQARILDWQVRTTFASGCAGAFVFKWTDEWNRGGYEIEDWAFGLTDRWRSPKPALDSVRRAFAEAPFPPDRDWPRISVVVCTYNGSRTIKECLDGLMGVQYQNHEIIVVSDGCTDETVNIVGRYPAKLIELQNGGLSNARNVGMREATGEIVAYIDDDAFPDPHWLHYLADTFMTTKHAAVGGPNIPPGNDGFIAECVAHAPGGPNHVLCSDTEAEHVPGCNMAFRKTALEEIGGFDRRFRIAGDDVDLCWRIQENGGTLGYNPAAVVWHHRRNSVRAYLRQQCNYGKAEAMLETKWPEKYNRFGHLSWRGRIYGNGPMLPVFLNQRVYHGVWGSNGFQSLYDRVPSVFLFLPLMPEWYLVIAGLFILVIAGLFWKPILSITPLLALALGTTILQVTLSAARASSDTEVLSLRDRLRRRILLMFLFFSQPLARLIGRLSFGLTPWRRRCSVRFRMLWPHTATIWNEQWESPERKLDSLERALRNVGAVPIHGGPYDRWDLEVRGGLLGGLRILMAVEEHGSGKQQIRLRSRPVIVLPAVFLFIIGAGLATAAALYGSWIACVIMGITTASIGICALGDCFSAEVLYIEAMAQLDGQHIRRINASSLPG